MLRITFFCRTFLFAFICLGFPGLVGNSLADAPAVSGTVLQTMDSGGYTYLEVQTGTGKQWVAIPESTVTTGTEVSYYDGMVMQNFHSKTLDKTFATIIFSPGLVQAQESAPKPSSETASDDSFAAAVQAEQQQLPSPPAAAMSGGSMGAVVPLDDSVTVSKAAGQNSYTIGELYSQAKDLKGKTIRVSGKVMKFSPLIMGRNWVHIQDGTGNPMQNSHDLVITTDATVENGTVVTFEGVLAADKDFGAGYKYSVIIEKAHLIQ